MKAALYAAILERSGGHCENCKRAFGLFLSTAEADHFRGRPPRVPENVETCWLICRDCHQSRHAAKPSAEFWVRRFLRHLQAHGYSEAPALRRLAWLEAKKGAA